MGASTPRLLVAIATLTLLGIAPKCAIAWEDDVHYGLTKWLSLKAGFSDAEAETIAKADRNVDSSPYTDPMHATIASACLGKDDRGSVAVHDNHFASKLNPPDDPAKRVVMQNQVYLRTRLQRPPTPGTGSFLTDLGAYLHVLQDTWSHQGQPDIPYACNPTYAWGHAQPRGGWSCHLADVTYWWADRGKDVLPMAERTYGILAPAAQKKTAPTWAMLRSEVDEFAHMRTKWEKDKWFEARGFLDRSFIEFTSLPDCIGGNCLPYKYRAIFELWDQTGANYVPIRDVPPQIAQFFDRFLQVMTRVPSPSLATLSEYVDLAGGVRALASSLNLETPCPQLNGLLAAWMLGNEFVTGRGGETPVVLCEAAAKLSEGKSTRLGCDEAVNLVSKIIGQAPPHAPAAIGPIPFLYIAFPGVERETYLALARFRHLPNDVLVLVANAQPRITTFAWLPVR
jgi:hypothetical protein